MCCWFVIYFLKKKKPIQKLIIEKFPNFIRSGQMICFNSLKKGEKVFLGMNYLVDDFCKGG